MVFLGIAALHEFLALVQWNTTFIFDGFCKLLLCSLHYISMVAIAIKMEVWVFLPCLILRPLNGVQWQRRPFELQFKKGREKKMDCFGTCFSHAQTCDNVRVQSATLWTSSVHDACPNL